MRGVDYKRLTQLSKNHIIPAQATRECIISSVRLPILQVPRPKQACSVSVENKWVVQQSGCLQEIDATKYVADLYLMKSDVIFPG